jgi:hypothetical protein
MLTVNRASSASLPSVTLNPADSSSRQPPAFHHASLNRRVEGVRVGSGVVAASASCAGVSHHGRDEAKRRGRGRRVGRRGGGVVAGAAAVLLLLLLLRARTGAENSPGAPAVKVPPPEPRRGRTRRNDAPESGPRGRTAGGSPPRRGGVDGPPARSTVNDYGRRASPRSETANSMFAVRGGDGYGSAEEKDTAATASR